MYPEEGNGLSKDPVRPTKFTLDPVMDNEPVVSKEPVILADPVKGNPGALIKEEVLNQDTAPDPVSYPKMYPEDDKGVAEDPERPTKFTCVSETDNDPVIPNEPVILAEPV